MLNRAHVASAKGYVVRHTASASLLGMCDRFCGAYGGDSRHYVAAFGRASVARDVLRWLPTCSQPMLRLDRAGGIETDVTLEVDEALRATGRTSSGSSVVIGLSARLHVAKKVPAKLERPRPFAVGEVTMDALMMMPFERNVGLLLPCALLADDSRELVFECHVIEPCNDPRLFFMG